jgi:dipeptide/tripeptide permease
VASLEGVMHGLYLVWLVHERGFSPALVATVLAAGDLCAFVLEVPTGWVADRLGHRLSLIAGSLVQVCGMVALWLAASTPTLVVASLLIALGDAFRSGADEALLYRSCAALGREGDFQAIEARTRSVGLVALVALLVAGGVLATNVGYTAAWISEIALCSLGLVLAGLMVEPPASPESSDLGDGASASPAKPVRPQWSLLASLLLPGALLDGLAGMAAFLAQIGIDGDAVGVTALVAAVTLSEAAGAWMGTRVWRRDGRLHLLLLACGAAVFAVSQLFPAGAAAAAVALAFLPGLIHPLRAAALQRVAGDGVRARIASLASACDMACTTLGLLAAGAVSARRSRR